MSLITVKTSNIFIVCFIYSNTAGIASTMISEDEPEEQDPFNCLGRIDELRRRNTLCLPHMRSVYPTESFEMTSGLRRETSSSARSSHSNIPAAGSNSVAVNKRTSVEAQLSDCSLEDNVVSKRRVLQIFIIFHQLRVNNFSILYRIRMRHVFQH